MIDCKRLVIYIINYYDQSVNMESVNADLAQA
jgi:hypothetical protein